MAKVIGCSEAASWLQPLLNGESAAKLMTLFGGDRISCVDEAVAVMVDGQIVGLATIAPNGESGSGKPTIVGAYVLPAFRGKGFGRQLLEFAIRRCLERGFMKIRLDVMSASVRYIVGFLPGELKSALDVVDCGDVLDSLLG